MEHKEWIKKAKKFKEALKINKDDGNIWLNYATFLREECDDPQELLKALETAQKFLPNKDLRYQIADTYVDIGEDSKGVNIIKDVLNEKKTAKGYCFLAEAYMKIENYDNALQACRDAIMLDQNYEEAYFLFGESVKHKSKNDAIKNYYKAVEIDPEFQEAWAALGRELVAIKDRTIEGIKCLDKALNLDPNDGWSMAYKANGLWNKGDISAADKAYNLAINIFPEYPDIYKWYADFLKAQDDDRANSYYLKYNKMKKSIESN